MKFWDRRYALTVDTIRTTDLDVQFKVVRTLSKAPNTCELTVFNLTQDHRHALAAMARVGVVLEAGYDGHLGMIFRGDLRKGVEITREGPDWLTKIVGDDGGDAIRGARVNASHGPGARVEDVLRTAARSMGVGLGNALEAARNGDLEGAGAQFAEGVVLSGPASRELDGLLASTGHEWSVQGGALQVLRRGAMLGGGVYRLTPDTGLIGSPTIAKGVLKATTLMLPALTPGAGIVVESEGIRGTFRVQKLTITGDTAGDDWGCEIEAKAPTP